MRRRKKRISSKDLQYVVAFAAVATLVTSGVAYGTLYPSTSEQFFAMWILGSGGLAEKYYPGDDPNLKIGEETNWTLGVYNHMGSLQYVVIRVKLINSTIASPDELAATPAPATGVFEFSRVLVENETWTIPFRWEIHSLTQRGESLLITGLSINQVLLTGNLVTAVSGHNYRFVFELWFYDLTLNDLTFSWETNSVKHSVWTQIWFNATAT